MDNANRGERAIMTLYIGQPIDIVIDCTLDGAKISTATSAVITYRKPDKTESSWTGTVDNVSGTVAYSAVAADIDQAGIWLLQPVVTFPGPKVIPGTTVEMPIQRRFT
jgi:hypothetical protein